MFKHFMGLLAMCVWNVAVGYAGTLSFQQDVDGYSGMADTWIGSANADTDNSASSVVEWDGEDGGGQNYGLLRFDDIFGSGPGQIPSEVAIDSAVLSYEVTNAGHEATVNEVLVDWAPPSPVTWNNFGGDAGVQSDEYGAEVGLASGASGLQTLNVKSSLAAWAVNPTLNRGWLFRPTGGTDGVEFVSSDAVTVFSRPRLVVTYTLLNAVDLSPSIINTVAGKSNIPLTVNIPPESNLTNAVVVTITTSDPAVAVPVGAVDGSLVVTFAAGAPTQQALAVAIGQSGSATITTSNDAGLDDATVPVTVLPGEVSVAPSAVHSGAGTTATVKVSISNGGNDTRTVDVLLATTDPSVVVPVGAVDGTRTVTFAAGGPTALFVDLQLGDVGQATIVTTNNGGLTDVGLPVNAFEGFNFTVTADPRTQVTRWEDVLASIRANITTPGVFHASPGDIDPPQPLRDAIDNYFGPAAIWYPLVGNHEVETAADMTWIRAEYHTGNGQRTALEYYTNQDGPAGSVETTFSWDYGNAHFISLNQYWNGGTTSGSDVATDGDIVPALYDWLAADLAANTRPAVFVFGHEPAFPFNRHVGDSLDKYPENRDAFWALLHEHAVHAFFCGHTHYYSRYQSMPDGTWQIDVGNAGNDPGDGQTFANVTVTSASVTYEIWRNHTGNWLTEETWSVPVGPRLAATPVSLLRTVRMGLPLSDDVIIVDAGGSDAVAYEITIDDSPTWLSVSPDSGVCSGQANEHSVIYSPTALPKGQYSATIRVAAPGAINSPRTISVDLSVTTPRADFDGDGDVDQDDFGHLQVCLSTVAGQITPECVDANLNDDTSVNQTDLLTFLNCFSGPDRPIPLDCP